MKLSHETLADVLVLVALLLVWAVVAALSLIQG